MTMPICRHCKSQLNQFFLDLGYAPPSNAYREPESMNKPELTYPLRLRVCNQCWLVQTEDYAEADQLFNSEYAYFSSTSKSWLEHAERYSSMIIKRFRLGSNSKVIEVASNDGYLLKNFLAAEIPCLGIEPTQSTARVSENLGIPVIRDFFTEQLAHKLSNAGHFCDLIIGNNVYAHVPDIKDFTNGLCKILKPEGIITLEFPHLMRLVESCQFDTVYHEHFSYLSFISVKNVFESSGLRVFDVEELTTHGGSLRIYGCHRDAAHLTSEAVQNMIDQEVGRGMNTAIYYDNFQIRVDELKNNFLQFLLEIKRLGKTCAAYGAAAKGNTLLNYAGIRPDLLPYVCDAAPSKQGKLMPGSHIPILAPEVLQDNNPDYLIILPWNIADEVKMIYSELSKKGTKFVTAVPEIIIE
jgi:hypothetical protein